MSKVIVRDVKNCSNFSSILFSIGSIGFWILVGFTFLF